MPEKKKYKDMVLVPGSEFYMGNEKKSRFTSAGQIILLKPFYIDAYPVTNYVYQEVVTDWKFDFQKKYYPVVGLKYDEILEYCRLTGKRLPSEAEWEKAARGDKDRRLYPWGNVFSNNKCNSRGRSFLVKKKPAAVDKFSEGKSVYGCFDMIGNVWEWTSTRIGEKRYILKGGCCTSPSKKYLTISSRLIAHKNDTNQNFGFRCCRSA